MLALRWRRSQVEVLSMVDDITVSEGKPNVHVHVVLGKRDSSTCAAI